MILVSFMNLAYLSQRKKHNLVAISTKLRSPEKLLCQRHNFLLTSASSAPHCSWVQKHIEQGNPLWQLFLYLCAQILITGRSRMCTGKSILTHMDCMQLKLRIRPHCGAISTEGPGGLWIQQAASCCSYWVWTITLAAAGGMMFSSNDPGKLQVYKICMNQMQSAGTCLFW